MKTKKPSRHFFRTLTILGIIFFGLYIAIQSGYYNARLGDRVRLTEEQIRQFEQDVRDGKEIDINNYITDEINDYSNRMTKAGVNLGNHAERFMNRGIKVIFDFLGTLFS